jgi:hypothetical protein
MLAELAVANAAFAVIKETVAEIVRMINSQPSAGGRRVKAACYINVNGAKNG